MVDCIPTSTSNPTGICSVGLFRARPLCQMVQDNDDSSYITMPNVANSTSSVRQGDLNGAMGRRITRRRSSAGPAAPVPPVRPQRPGIPNGSVQRQAAKPTYLTLRDHGKVFVADLPRLSDGQLTQVAKEASEVLESLERRLSELAGAGNPDQGDNDMRIRAATKRDVTERFLRAIDEEQTLRRNNPAIRAAAGESLARAFLELARHRLPGSTFDSLLQEPWRPAALRPPWRPTRPAAA